MVINSRKKKECVLLLLCIGCLLVLVKGHILGKAGMVQMSVPVMSADRIENLTQGMKKGKPHLIRCILTDMRLLMTVWTIFITLRRIWGTISGAGRLAAMWDDSTGRGMTSLPFLMRLWNRDMSFPCIVLTKTTKRGAIIGLSLPVCPR